MGVRNPQTASLSLRSYQGRSKSGIILPTIRNDFGIILPFVSAKPLRQFYPRPSEATMGIRHAHNTTYPGAKYECLVQAYGGSPPYLYEIVRGAPGMTIEGFLTADGSGDLWPTSSYGVLTHDSMPSGSHSIAIRCTDQARNYVTFEWVLDSDLSLNFFTAPTASGSGLGTSEANPMAFADVYKGATTNSPAKGRVLRLLGGSYTGMPTIEVDAGFQPTSFAAVSGHTPVFTFILNNHANDFFISGIKFLGVPVSSFGVVNFPNLNHRITAHRITFDGCTDSSTETANVACFGANDLTSGLYARENICIVDCTFKNSIGLHGYDFYAVDSYVFERNICIIDNPAITAQTHAWIFPKAGCYGGQIAYNKYDNPHIPASSDGIIQIYNGVGENSKSRFISDIYYNKFRTGASGNTIRSNAARNLVTLLVVPSVLVTNTFYRNNISGGTNTVGNCDFDFNVEKQSFFDKNAIQSSNPSVIVVSTQTVSRPNSAPVWWTNTGTECQGTAGIFDANMNLNPAYSAHVGNIGAQLRMTT